MKKLDPRLVRILKLAATLGTLAYVGNYLFDNIRDVDFSLLRVNSALVVVSLLLFMASLVVQAGIWHLLTRLVGAAIPAREAISAWLYSKLGKYLPAKVLLFTMIAFAYRKREVAWSRISVCFALETACAWLGAFFAFLISCACVQIDVDPRIQQLLAVSILVLMVGIHPRVLNRFLNFVLTRFGREPVELPLSYASLLGIVGLYTADYFLFGFSAALFARGVTGSTDLHLFYNTASWSFAGLVGSLALFVPSGLGVREGLLALMLGKIYTKALASLLSLSSRVWITVGEFALIGLAATQTSHEPLSAQTSPDPSA